MGKIQYLLGNEQIAVWDTAYADAVKMTAIVPEEKKAYIEKSLIDATGAKAELVWMQKTEFARNGKEILLFTADDK